MKHSFVGDRLKQQQKKLFSSSSVKSIKFFVPLVSLLFVISYTK